LIRKAFDVSVEAHKEQRRKSGKPIFHPIAVAKIVASEMGLGATSIAAALLHDVVEDTPLPLKTLNGFLIKSGATCRRLTKISLVQRHERIDAGRKFP
jgi:GTP pyrophosphokinase